MPDVQAVRAFLDERHLTFARRIESFVGQNETALTGPDDDDAARVRAREILSLLGEGEWYKPIETEDLRSCCLVRETLSTVSPLADEVFALQALGTVPILLKGSDDLLDRWAKPALRGELMAAFAMTEREAGSDVAAIRTTAVRDGDSYVLNGTKTLISNAGIADFYSVFASTDPAAGGKGLSCFVVPAETPGFRFVRAQVLSAPHPLGEIAFEDCRVPATNRLGDGGRGLALGLATLGQIRPTVGAAACGMAERALREAIDHARHREQFGKPLAEQQLIQEKLARMAIELTAARLLVYRAGWEKDNGAARIPIESAMGKAYATEAAQRIVDDAVQVLGGRGVLAECVVDKMYRSVRALRIYEGTTEIQHLIIAGHLIAHAAKEETAREDTAREDTLE